MGAILEAADHNPAYLLRGTYPNLGFLLIGDLLPTSMKVVLRERHLPGSLLNF